MTQVCLNLLILEDDEEIATQLKERMARDGDKFNLTFATNVEDTIKCLNTTLFHLVSFDQRIPLTSSPKPYEKDDVNFGAVLSAYEATQPVAVGLVLTGFGSIPSAVDAERHGLHYLQKSADAIGKWPKELKRLRKHYLQDVLIRRGPDRLPNALARSVQNLRDQEHMRMRLLAARDLFENSIRLFVAVLASVAVADSGIFASAVSTVQRLFGSDRRNTDWIAALTELMKLLAKGNAPMTKRVNSEVIRFLLRGSSPFVTAVDQMHQLRNELAHDRLQKAATYEAIYTKHEKAIHTLLEGVFFFATHPILGDVTPRHVTSGPSVYRADDFRGDSLTPPRIDVRCDDDVPSGELVWALMDSPSDAAAVFRLPPLLKAIVDHDSQQTGLYLLDNAKRYEYREMSTGRRHSVTDENERQLVRDILKA